jgi:hypothetical protein
VSLSGRAILDRLGGKEREKRERSRRGREVGEETNKYRPGHVKKKKLTNAV